MKEQETLIDRAGRGDGEAFARLVELWREKVYRVAFRVLFDKNRALDVAQEVFLKLHQELKKGRGDIKYEGWIHRVTLNQAIDHYRRRQRERTPPLLADDADGLRVERHPERYLESVRAQDMLRTAMAALTDHQRQVFILRHYEGLKLKEIAGITGLAEGTVKATLHQAMMKMRTVLLRRA